MLEPTFGGINLKDIRAPEGFEIYDRLRERLRIPVFHENLYSTAVVAAAALINALDLADKESTRSGWCSAARARSGPAARACCLSLGVRPENLLLYDVDGPDPSRPGGSGPLPAGLRPRRRGAQPRAGPRAARTCSSAPRPAGVLTPEMIRSMARFPVVFAIATPEPEIGYEEARASRRDAIVATSLGQHPNAILDLLSFPYIFRGALDVQATRITAGMLLAAARAWPSSRARTSPRRSSAPTGASRSASAPSTCCPSRSTPASSCASRPPWPGRRSRKASPAGRWRAGATRRASPSAWAPAARPCAG